MNKQKRQFAERIYLISGAIFIAALVSCNLIFQKFFYWNPFGIYHFEISVGILPYPVTFLITDVVSEIYGKKKANQIVLAGLFASLFTILVVVVSSNVPATSWSPVNDLTFTRVFGFTFIAVAASMIAYLLAQFIDIQVFHFWKNLTKGKHLWLRNNASTFTSQFTDTITVLLLLCSFEVIEWKYFNGLLVSGFLFKVIVALFDTPFVYLSVFLLRRHFGLKNPGEELKL